MPQEPPDIEVRIAEPSDATALDALLQAAYGSLPPDDYADGVLARALPRMTRTQPALLATSTFYVARPTGAPALPIGCGGWTLAAPGRAEAGRPGVAHLRHFATHPSWLRRGVGRAIFERCLGAATVEGVQTFECYATFMAEPFYRSIGFQTVERIDLPFGDGLRFPALRMRRDIALHEISPSRAP